jgi:hypothetical protein
VFLVLVIFVASQIDAQEENYSDIWQVVSMAIKNRDFDELANHMVEKFRYDHNLPGSKELALEFFSQNPLALEEMDYIFSDTGCMITISAKNEYYVCPAVFVVGRPTELSDFQLGFGLDGEGEFKFL